MSDDLVLASSETRIRRLIAAWVRPAKVVVEFGEPYLLVRREPDGSELAIIRVRPDWPERVYAKGIATFDKHFIFDAEPVEVDGDAKVWKVHCAFAWEIRASILYQTHIVEFGGMKSLAANWQDQLAKMQKRYEEALCGKK